MTTPTPQDPYSPPPAPTGAPTVSGGDPGAPVAPPAPPLPGQAPPVGGYAANGWAPEKPSGLAITTIVLTGLYTLMQIFAGMTAQSTTDAAKESIESGETSVDATSTLIQGGSGILGIAAFVVLALWMSRIRSNLAKRGITAGGPPHVEWWGWFVPLANYVLPFLGMRAIAHRKVGMGVLLGWWLPWCLVFITSIGATVASTFAFDFQTGELANPEALDASVPLTYVATLATIVSWIFLTMIVRRVTARHLED